jgi:hypothetical protein
MTFPNDEGLGWLMKNRTGWKEVYQYADSAEQRALWNSFHDLGRYVNNVFIPGVRGPGTTEQRLSRDPHPV